jgi:hypothetical protein
MISAKVIEDSINGLDGVRLTTFQLEYPRFIHAEVMTHRAWSRNASSSRAIPIATSLARIRDDPAMPVYWGRNQKGMQAGQELTGWRKAMAIRVWRGARYLSMWAVQVLDWLGVHKQIGNRLTESHAHIQVVVTATDWANFYALRNHPDAQPEIQELARQMLAAHEASTPMVLKLGDWHLPYVSLGERVAHKGKLTYDILLPKLSAARCARVSYLLRDGKVPDVEADIKLFERLAGGTPIHASPLEHPARVAENPVRSNFRGNWNPFRKCLPDDTIRVYRGFDERE